MPSQLEILPPEQAALLIRKKRFWKKTMRVSLVLSIVVSALGVAYYKSGMSRMSEELANQQGLAGVTIGMDTMAITIMVFIPLSALAFLLFLVSLIRRLSLPKLTQAG